MAAATATIESAVKQHGIIAIGVVASVRRIPDDLERILRSHALVHAAEGALFEEALLDAAERIGLDCLAVEPKGLRVSDRLDAAGKVLGPPWQKDHKLGGAAGLRALDEALR